MLRSPIYEGGKTLAEREGFESAQERKLSNMQGHGWHESVSKAAVNRLTDRKQIAPLGHGVGGC
jgi:hypothetical protein